MGKIEITRKKFLTTALAGFAALKFIPKSNSENLLSHLVRHNLGKTGIAVSPICFGASRANDKSLIKYTIDKGINFIDTGRAYADGNNEKLIGKVISGNRENVVIQSKLRLDPNELVSGGKGKKGAREIRSVLSSKVEASLKALNSDYIDILLYHDAREESLLFHPEVLKFFAGLKSSGVIRAHGFSTHNDRMILHERNNKECFYEVIMVPFNHKGSFIHSVTGKYSEWDQSRLIPILIEAGEKGIGVIAMKTCSGGKYSPSPGFEPNYKEAVKWVLQHPFISSAAIAMANFEQVDELISFNNY
jgi:aryl-alcohol dehydrogenase-like predicted oxidoreductase